MAKAKTRRRGTSRGGSIHTRSTRTTPATTPLVADRPEDASLVPVQASSSLKRSGSQFGSLGKSGLLSTGMVALGCWGMAAFFFLFYNDPNRGVFGAMAALMALMWSYSFVARLRRRQRQR